VPICGEQVEPRVAQEQDARDDRGRHDDLALLPQAPRGDREDALS